MFMTITTYIVVILILDIIIKIYLFLNEIIHISVVSEDK